MKTSSLFFLFVISFLFQSCSKQTDKKLWENIEQAKQNQQYDSTIQLCQTLLQEYPKSPLAHFALYTIAETYRNGKHDYPKALQYYRQYAEQYPNTEHTPVATFLVGFIYNNDLNNPDSAKVGYERFLSKFPNHELARSAKFELENIGKTPEEILSPKKHVVKKR